MKIVIQAFFIYFLVYSSNIFSSEKQVIISVHEEWSQSLSIIKELLSDSYNEIGYQVIFRDLPPARGLNELKHGKVDGDLSRIEKVAIAYGATVIRPAYFTLRIYAYYQKEKFKKAPSINDIKNGKVAYINGSFGVEQFLINPKAAMKVNNQLQLVNLLKRNRVDYIIPSSVLAFEGKNFKKVLIIELGIYHILSGKNKELAKKLEPVFKKNMSKKKYADLQDQIEKMFFDKSK